MNITKGKLITAFLSFFLSAALLGFALVTQYSMAWFAKDDKVSSTGQSFTTFRITGANIASIDIFKRSGADDSAKRVYNTNDEVIPAIEMTEYDTIFTDRNVNTPIILRLVLDNPPESGLKGIVISSTCLAGHWTDTGTKSGKLTSWFSNVIGMRCACVDSLNSLDPANAADAALIYSGAVTALTEATPDLTGFVSVNADADYANVSKNELIRIDVSNVSVTADRTVILYMEIDYVPDLAQAFILQNGIDVSHSSAAGQDVIHFDYDLSSIAVDYK